MSSNTTEPNGEIFITSIDTVQHAHLRNDLERQVFARISSEGFDAEQLSSYIMLREQKVESDAALQPLAQELKNPLHGVSMRCNHKTTGVVPNKSKSKESSDKTSFQIECDLYLKMYNMKSDITLDHLLKDVTNEMVHLSKSCEPHTITLRENDWLWMEISEKAQHIKRKMIQLERAYRYFVSIEREDLLPRCFIICLNGDRAAFDAAINVLQNDDLNNWEIVNAGIPCVAIYTEYRNVYGAIADIYTEMKKMNGRIGRIEKMICFQTIAILALSFLSLRK